MNMARRRFIALGTLLGATGASTTAGLLASLVIGGLAGFYPAIRAANMPPTEALRTR